MNAKYIWLGLCIFSLLSTKTLCMKGESGITKPIEMQELEYFVEILNAMNTKERQNIRNYLSKIGNNERYMCRYGREQLAEFDNHLQILTLRSLKMKYIFPYTTCILPLMTAIRIHSDSSWSPEIKRAVKLIDKQFTEKLKLADIESAALIAQGRPEDEQESIPWCWLF